MTGGCRRTRNFFRYSAFKEGTTETHLAKRAWTFQERMLPARTMYFGDKGLFWRCRSRRYTEFACNEDFDLGPRRDTRGNRLEDQPWEWDDIVSEYSMGQLTVPSDKLPALSGIAARQGDITRDRYLAGLWRESLETQLCWCMEDRIYGRPEWRAPTWSWASVDGRIFIPSYKVTDEDLLIRVEDAWTTLGAPSLPYGAVRGGELMISCSHLFRGHLCTGR